VHSENFVDVHMSGDDKLNVPLSQLTAIWCSHVIDLVVSRKQKEVLVRTNCAWNVPVRQGKNMRSLSLRRLKRLMLSSLTDTLEDDAACNPKKLSPRLYSFLFLMPWNWSDKMSVSPGWYFGLQLASVTVSCDSGSDCTAVLPVTRSITAILELNFLFITDQPMTRVYIFVPTQIPETE
jgi:hypothetical protein